MRALTIGTIKRSLAVHNIVLADSFMLASALCAYNTAAHRVYMREAHYRDGLRDPAEPFYLCGNYVHGNCKANAFTRELYLSTLRLIHTNS